MKKFSSYILFFALLFCVYPLSAQSSSFILLGDVHYDQMEDHDFEWVNSKYPNDLSQIEGYVANTSANWDDFMKHLSYIVKTNTPEVKALIQVGDLSEGLAGDTKADQMAKNVMDAIDKSGLGVPWLIAKGNHDITSGTPAKSAFTNNYIPMFRKQTGNNSINSANYSYMVGNIEFFVCDYYNRSSSDPIAWLDAAAKASTAAYKFAIFHQPVIPVTERCWHMYATDNSNRQRLLQVMATNKLIALVGHLHRYSVVRRTTEWGPIVQIMATSVISNRNDVTTSNMITEYGPSIASNLPTYSPETLDARIAMLTAEQAYVTFYKQCTLHGFGVLDIDEITSKMKFEYYGGFSCVPFDTVDISALTAD